MPVQLLRDMKFRWLCIYLSVSTIQYLAQFVEYETKAKEPLQEADYRLEPEYN